MTQTLDQLKSLGRYHLIRELGRGGMSVVYLANDSELGREVAIKCVDIDNHSNARLADHLRSEAKLLAQLNHPNIVQLYDVVEHKTILGLVIEYVGGESLTQRLKQHPSRKLVLKWLAEIAEGLDSAHQKGITHCDLKTDNILITSDNIAKIADFGIAKAKLNDYLHDQESLQKGKVSGSYFSLSPEQATGQAVDSRTDLFSFAVLIYQSLVGGHPFGDTNDKTTLLQRIINDPLELNSDARHKLQRRLTELVQNLLSKNPTERLYNAKDSAQLIKGEFEAPSETESEDNTVEINTIAAATSESSKHNLFERLRSLNHGVFGKLSLLGLGFMVGIAILKFFPGETQASSNVKYIALDTVAVTATEPFNIALLPLVESTLQESVESTLLSFNQTGLIEAKELNSIDGSYSRKALVSGASDIVVVSASCLHQKCDIKLQRRSGKLMAVVDQRSFPIASNSLIELKNAITTQLPSLFDQTSRSFSGDSFNLNEDNYRRYLEIYTASNSGSSTDETHLNNIQKLISDSPNFTPSYTLLYHLSSYQFRNNGQKSLLNNVLNIFETAPSQVRNNKVIKRTIINALLDLGRVQEAKSNFSLLKEEVKDALFLSEIESSIAFAEDDYQKLLELDRQNAIWRPSANNLYNLATSEFFFGNHQKAKDELAKVLKLSPIDPYALDLQATIEMSLGNLSQAKSIYETLLTNSEDSNVYSNYGLTLTLNKEYKKAIEALTKAVNTNPDASLHRLNLADAYFLSGDFEMAKKGYEKVISLLATPQSVQDYSHLAQAQVHLGEHANAVKTLKTANKKFPDIAELDYAASIVNTLAGNYVAASVDVSDAIDHGTAAVWFTFEWFKPLCSNKEFREVTGTATNQLCIRAN